MSVLSYCAIYVPEEEHVTLAQLQVEEAISAMNLFDEGRFGRVKRAHLLYICYVTQYHLARLVNSPD